MRAAFAHLPAEEFDAELVGSLARGKSHLPHDMGFRYQGNRDIAAHCIRSEIHHGVRSLQKSRLPGSERKEVGRLCGYLSASRRFRQLEFKTSLRVRERGIAVVGRNDERPCDRLMRNPIHYDSMNAARLVRFGTCLSPQ